jgi:putative membrane protein
LDNVNAVAARQRWPGWVFGSGSEPDVRFSFANERTFLAWIRTALALLAAGVALDALDLTLSDRVQHALAVLMVVLGLLSATASWWRWARAERAMRRGEPLPASGSSAFLVLGVAAAAVILLVGL